MDGFEMYLASLPMLSVVWPLDLVVMLTSLPLIGRYVFFARKITEEAMMLAWQKGHPLGLLPGMHSSLINLLAATPEL